MIRVIRVIRAAAAVAILLLVQSFPAWAQRPFLSDAQWSDLRHEAGGAAPYETCAP